MKRTTKSRATLERLVNAYHSFGDKVKEIPTWKLKLYLHPTDKEDEKGY